VTAGLAAAVALIAATAVPAHAESPAVTCRYTFSAWSGGFSADLAMANSGPAIDGWEARWSFAIPTQATGVWSAQLVQATPTQMVATPAVWNKKIPTGGVVSFGWTATAISTEVPSDITVNGQRC
jgi:hypothetical protein